MEEFKKRKPVRLTNFDYSSHGAYFITICANERGKELFSQIVPLAPTENVGDGAYDVPKEFLGVNVELTPMGKIAEKYLLSSQRISGVEIDEYVIMPDHIHAIIIINSSSKEADGTSRAPSPTNATLPHVISVFKRLCNREIGRNVFQRSYMDHVLQNREDHEKHVRYIRENPMKWHFNKTETDICGI